MVQPASKRLVTEAAGNATYIPRWKPNTAYTLGQQVVSPSNDVVSAKIAFTSGATYLASNWTQSSTFALLRKTLAAAVAGATGVPPVMASGAPTVTVGAAWDYSAAGITGPVGYDPTSSPVRFNVLGTTLFKGSGYYSNAWAPAELTPGNLTYSLQPWSIQFWSDAAKFELLTTAGGTLRVWMNGQKTSAADTTVPTGGVDYPVRVDATTRAMRLWRVEFDNNLGLIGLTVGAIDTVTPAQLNGAKAFVMGDSYIEGGQFATARYSGIAYQLGQLMGWADTHASGSGGTGYLTTAATGRVTYRSRLAHDVTSHNPDVIVFTGGRNDGGQTNGAMQAEATALLTQARTACPNALLVVVSPFNKDTAETTSFAGFCTALQAATVAVPGTIWLDVRGFLTGSGNTATPAGNGNADLCVGADGVHPTPQGAAFWARVIAALLTNALAA